MRTEELTALLGRMTAAAEAGDGRAFADCFTEDALYDDYVYGPHRGRAEIARMLEELFHRDAAEYRWHMFDAVCDGDLGYAWSLSTFLSKVPEFAGRRVVIDGMSRFRLEGDRIAEYRESVNAGVAMVQLGVAPARMEKVFRKWTGRLLERRATRDYVARDGR